MILHKIRGLLDAQHKERCPVAREIATFQAPNSTPRDKRLFGTGGLPVEPGKGKKRRYTIASALTRLWYKVKRSDLVKYHPLGLRSQDLTIPDKRRGISRSICRFGIGMIIGAKGRF